MRQIIGGSDPQVAVSQFDADAELAAVLDELRTTPFLAPRRAVIVRDADVFIAHYREIDVAEPKKGHPRTRRPLDEYLASPSPHSSLILLVGSWRSDATLAKVVAKVGEVVDCTPPEDSKLPEFVRKAAAKRGKKFDAQAAQLPGGVDRGGPFGPGGRGGKTLALRGRPPGHHDRGRLQTRHGDRGRGRLRPDQRDLRRRHPRRPGGPGPDHHPTRRGVQDPGHGGLAFEAGLGQPSRISPPACRPSGRCRECPTTPRRRSWGTSSGGRSKSSSRISGE